MGERERGREGDLSRIRSAAALSMALISLATGLPGFLAPFYETSFRPFTARYGRPRFPCFIAALLDCIVPSPSLHSSCSALSWSPLLQ